VDTEQCTAPLQMVVESPLCGIDAGLGSGLARVSDVDNNQGRLARVGQSLLHGFLSVTS
jgi:hypothetical protein